MANISTSSLIKDADEKVKAKAVLTEEIAALREILRNLDKAGQLTDQESAWVAEAFPPVKRGSKENGDGSDGGAE